MLLALIAAAAASEGIYPLDGVAADTPDAALAPFAEVIGEARFVGLGESRHCGGTYLEAKARLVRWLVETQGFRLVAIESPWVWARTATEYVATGQGDATAAMRSIFAAFHDDGTVAMLEWLAAWNVAHPEDPVRFHGFDVQDGLPRLLGALKVAGVAPEEIAICEAGACEVTSDSPWAQLAASTITVRHALDAEKARPGRGAYSEVRDLGMADTLLAIRGIVAPEARTVVLAHNMHLTERGSAIRSGWTDTGEHLAGRLGEDYVSVGLVARDLATSCQGAPQEDGRRDIEREIGERAGSAAALVDLGVASDFAGRWSVGGQRVVAGDQFDALLWFDRAGPADNEIWVGSPMAAADAVGSHFRSTGGIHRTPDEPEERERLWTAYSSWLAAERGCVADGRRHRAPWGQLRWQRFECESGSLVLRSRRYDEAWWIGFVTDG